MAIKNYFPSVLSENPNDPLSLLPSPYYEYSGQNNLFTPRGYAQGTLINLLSTRGALGEATEDGEVTTEATEATEPAFQEVKDSGEQSFFNGMDINEGDSLDFDTLSDLSLTDGLFGGKTVSGNAPTGWNTQHQREFDAFVAAGLKPKAKWNGNDWYVYANELDGTPFGEQGSMSLSDTISSGGKYDGQPPGLFGVAQTATGSFNPNDVFKKNLAEALKSKTSPEEFTELQTGSFNVQESDGFEEFTELQPVQKDEGSVTAKRGGTVTAKEGGTVKAKRPDSDPKPKPKSISLKKTIEKAINTLVQQDNSSRDDEKKVNRTDTTAIDKVRKESNLSGNQRRGYGF